jgi:hypothetical protein
MKKIDSRLFRLPYCTDLSIPISAEDGFEFVALLHKEMFFVYGILFDNISFFKLSRDTILTLKDEYQSDKIFQYMPFWLSNAFDFDILKSQGYISYINFDTFEKFKNENKDLFK